MIGIISTLIFLSIFQSELPQKELIGLWFGKSEVFASFKKEEYPSKNPADFINIEIKINLDNTVEGKIGKAYFKNCIIKKNRGSIERLLGLKTDFIICNGYLSGKIVDEDNESKRDFTIPFNIEGEKIKGSFMVLSKLEYPKPMFPRLILEKKENNNHNSQSK